MLSLASVVAAHAESPRTPAARPVRVVVPFLGGGVADSVARIVVSRARDLSKTPYQVENRPGDDGHFGAEVVAKSEPDGTVALFAPVTLYAAAVSLFRDLHYSLESDFTPVTLIANAPHLLLVHPSLPVKSVKDLLALAKARPGEVRWLAHGRSSLSRLELDMLSSLGGIRLAGVPYSKSGTVLPELAAGNAELAFDSIAAALPHIKSGKLRAIAVAGARRSPALRDVPTVAEGGVAGFEANYWYALLVPEGAAKPVVERLSDDFTKAIASPETRERLLPHGIEAHASTGAELAKIIRDDVAKWANVAKNAGAVRP